ncbi:metal ABC transporter solute-binding protein, Zn/Mn family [Haloimpatiens sp. FM7315]|uniref:metal ABC transporter solute-binding protein, Zn/Mn family n=1 Tax=Haloimpatiens sp. FM7315 TaxID=3298609 RepID=UPI0035A276DE
MKKIRKLKLSFIILCLVFLMSGCTKNTSYNKDNTSKDKLTVAVSIVPEETFVKKVAGDLVNVVTLVPKGKSPENSQPTPEILEAFSSAKSYFTIGVPTEASSILPKVKSMNENVKIIDLFSTVQNTYKPRKFGENSMDPHIWLSPKRAKIMVEAIKDDLSSLDPKNKKIYENNASNYIKSLDDLDIYVKNTLKNMKNRNFIVYHPAFGYFAEDYNLNMVALEKEGKEASPKDMEKVIDFAKKEDLKVVFYQDEVDSKQSTAFAESIKGKSKELSPLASNYIENIKSMAKAIAESNK